MSDRLLAITLALILALPLFVSLDGDLFDPRRQPGPAVETEALLQAPAPAGLLESPAPDTAALTARAREAARRLSIQALEAMDKQSQGLENAITWRSAPTLPPEER